MKRMKKLMGVLLAIALLAMPYTNVFADNEIPYSTQESDENAAPYVAQYVWVDTDVLNVRSGPGTGYSVVGTVKRNQRLWITYAQYDSSGVDWYKCNAIGGWVCSLYVRYSA